MSGFHWPAYLLFVTVIVTGFVLIRRWYAKDQQRSRALLVVGSSKVRGYEKLCWTLTALFLSWLGFLVLMVVHGGRTATTRG